MDLHFVTFFVILVAGCHGQTGHNPALMPVGLCEKAFYPSMKGSVCADPQSEDCLYVKSKFCARPTRFGGCTSLTPTQGAEWYSAKGEFITVRCEKDSCRNDGTIRSCTCKTGFSGEFCEKADCNGVTCPEGGTCVPNRYDSTFTCKCLRTVHFEGRHICEQAHEWGSGDPHFRTLDGNTFTMWGSNAPCMYYLAVADDFVIELETSDTKAPGAPATSWRVVIAYGGTVVSLGYNNVAKIIRGHQWTTLQLPFENHLFHCYQENSRSQKCVLDNSVTVSFETGNPWGRHEVDIPKYYYGKVKGLVGYFDGDSSNDFMMRNGKVSPKSPTNKNRPFEDSWKIPGLCGTKKREVTEREEIERILGQNPCRFVNNSVFDNCKAELRKEHYYDICKFDFNFCPKDSKSECFCGILDDLVTNCDVTNHPVGEWRKKVEICNKKCPEGEVYNSCGNPCTYSCDNIKMDAEGYCVGSCLPMCACPNGLTRDAHGKCIPQSECP